VLLQIFAMRPGIRPLPLPDQERSSPYQAFLVPPSEGTQSAQAAGQIYRSGLRFDRSNPTTIAEDAQKQRQGSYYLHSGCVHI